LTIDTYALETKVELENQVNGEYSLLGFYVSGNIDGVEDVERKLYNTFRNYADSILIILYDPTKKDENSKKLPLKVFEKCKEDETFKEREFEIKALHEEIITLETVMKSVQQNISQGSRYVAGMKTFDSSVNIYAEKLDIIKN